MKVDDIDDLFEASDTKPRKKSNSFPEFYCIVGQRIKAERLKRGYNIPLTSYLTGMTEGRARSIEQSRYRIFRGERVLEPQRNVRIEDACLLYLVLGIRFTPLLKGLIEEPKYRRRRAHVEISSVKRMVFVHKKKRRHWRVIKKERLEAKAAQLAAEGVEKPCIVGGVVIPTRKRKKKKNVDTVP